MDQKPIYIGIDREGLSLAWTRDGQHQSMMVVAEEEARRDGTGCLSRGMENLRTLLLIPRWLSHLATSNPDLPLRNLFGQVPNLLAARSTISTM